MFERGFFQPGFLWKPDADNIVGPISDNILTTWAIWEILQSEKSTGIEI